MAIPISEQVRCVKREIRQRERVYPRLVESGRMKSADADREIATMVAVLVTLERLGAEKQTEMEIV